MRQRREPLAAMRLTLAIEEPRTIERATEWEQVAPEYLARGQRLYRLDERRSTPAVRFYEWYEGLTFHTILVVRPPP